MIGGMSDVALYIEEEGWKKHPNHPGFYRKDGQMATLSMLVLQMLNPKHPINPFGRDLP